MPEDLLPDFDLKIMPGRGVICSPPYLVLHIHANLSCTNAKYIKPTTNRPRQLKQTVGLLLRFPNSEKVETFSAIFNPEV